MLCAYVGYVQWAMFVHPLKPWVIIADLHTDSRYRTKMSARNHYVSVAEAQDHVVDPANLCCALDNGVEHRLHVRGRAADDAEHLGGGRLMLQGLPQFRVALLQFLKQCYVLDRDNCLIREGFKQFNLLIREWTNLSSKDQNRPNRNFLS